jgi:arginine-tRNA-protein transferase
MESLFRYVAPPSTCGYLPDRRWSLEYEMVAAISAEEYQQRLIHGWRRFGGMMFRPQCPACQACQSLRVEVAHFRPSRSQRRARKANEGAIECRVGSPTVSRAKLQLYDRFHAFQSDMKGWPIHPAKDAASYRESFVNNPPFTEEWCYFAGDHLIGVGYVDRLPDGLSAIYFFYEPDERTRSLGTWNVLAVIDEADRGGLPFVYLGYYVAGCSSLSYKANFRPNQILQPDGSWRNFLGHAAE